MAMHFVKLRPYSGQVVGVRIPSIKKHNKSKFLISKLFSIIGVLISLSTYTGLDLLMGANSYKVEIDDRPVS